MEKKKKERALSSSAMQRCKDSFSAEKSEYGVSSIRFRDKCKRLNKLKLHAQMP